VLYPAAYDGVVAVSAVDAASRHLYFANRGEPVDLAAPGIGVAAASTNNEVGAFSGTSAAAPFVSGALAALLAANPGLSGAEAVALLARYSDDMGAPGRDAEYGAGVLDLRRVLNRNTRGIYDMAACDLTVEYQVDADPFIVVTAQNRGTEALRMVRLEVDAGGRQESVAFTGVQPTQTISHRMRLSLAAIERQGGLRVTWRAVLVGQTDASPYDNERTVTVVRSPAGR
jgi:subtilisin family serine protease